MSSIRKLTSIIYGKKRFLLNLDDVEYIDVDKSKDEMYFEILKLTVLVRYVPWKERNEERRTRVNPLSNLEDL